MSPQDDKPGAGLAEIEDMHEITVRIAMPRAAAAQAKVVPTIRVVAGPDMLSYITIPEDSSVIIGRDEAADLQLIDATVSKQHAKLMHESGGSLLVVDLNSTNGTAVNGQPITRTILRPGDHLEIGASRCGLTCSRRRNSDTCGAWFLDSRPPTATPSRDSSTAATSTKASSASLRSATGPRCRSHAHSLISTSSSPSTTSTRTRSETRSSWESPAC